MIIDSSSVVVTVLFALLPLWKLPPPVYLLISLVCLWQHALFGGGDRWMVGSGSFCTACFFHLPAYLHTCMLLLLHPTHTHTHPSQYVFNFLHSPFPAYYNNALHTGNHSAPTSVSLPACHHWVVYPTPPPYLFGQGMVGGWWVVVEAFLLGIFGGGQTRTHFYTPISFCFRHGMSPLPAPPPSYLDLHLLYLSLPHALLPRSCSNNCLAHTWQPLTPCMHTRWIGI